MKATTPASASMSRRSVEAFFDAPPTALSSPSRGGMSRGGASAARPAPLKLPGSGARTPLRSSGSARAAAEHIMMSPNPAMMSPARVPLSSRTPDRRTPAVSTGGGGAQNTAHFKTEEPRSRMSTAALSEAGGGGTKRWAPSPPWSHSYRYQGEGGEMVSHAGTPSKGDMMRKSTAKSMSRASVNILTQGELGPLHPVKTLRRMYDDKSEWVNEYEFLHSIEKPTTDWAPESGTHTTIFHKGFARGRQGPPDPSVKVAADKKEERHLDHTEKRKDFLGGQTRHRFLTDEDTGKVSGGRKHFSDGGNIVLRGPESCVPRANDMGTKRMHVMVTEGLVKPRTESVKDLFTNMFGYAPIDMA